MQLPDYMSNLTSMMKNIQKPMQAMMDLNAHTLQNMSYLKPDDLTNIHRPEELMEKQINVFIENGHKALDYMQRSFAILEESFTMISKEVRERSEQARTQMQSSLKDSNARGKAN